jgi:hypothetical protein
MTFSSNYLDLSLTLLDIVQKLHSQFLIFSAPPFFVALEVFKEKSKKMNLISRKED